MADTSKYVTSWKDRFNKNATASVHATLLSAGNFAAQATLRAALLTAFQAMTEDFILKESVLAAEITNTISPPTSDGAKNGVRWLFRAVDTNGNAVVMQLPGAKTSLLPDTNRSLNLTADEGLAAKTAWDAYVKSNDGEDTVLVEVIYLDK
jgi:hypothetical protein